MRLLHVGLYELYVLCTFVRIVFVENIVQPMAVCRLHQAAHVDAAFVYHYPQSAWPTGRVPWRRDAPAPCAYRPKAAFSRALLLPCTLSGRRPGSCQRCCVIFIVRPKAGCVRSLLRPRSFSSRRLGARQALWRHN